MNDDALSWGTIALALIKAAPLTLSLTFWSILIGASFAILLAVLSVSTSRLAHGFANAYIFVFRSTPLLVQIFIIYYGLASFQSVRESIAWLLIGDAYGCAILALSLNTAAYSAEILKAGLLAIPKGQIEAARAAGMSGLLLVRRIYAPQIIRKILPAYSNEIILMVKSTSLASTITLMEITGVAAMLSSESYQVIEVIAMAGILYLAINFILSYALKALEHRLMRAELSLAR